MNTVRFVVQAALCLAMIWLIGVGSVAVLILVLVEEWLLVAIIATATAGTGVLFNTLRRGLPPAPWSSESLYPDVMLRKRLRAITKWATEIRKYLQPILDRHPDVHFRPGAAGIAMVGLRPESPQRGRSGITNLARLAENFDEEFHEHCVNNPPGRPTPEKELQSHLIREAYDNGRKMAFSRNKMAPLNATDQDTAAQVELLFVTDEIRLPVQGEEKVCDILTLRSTRAGHVPVLIELKTERLKTKLIEQVEEYSRLIDRHADLFGELYSALLGYPIAFAGPCERWIVWPAAGNNDGTDTHEDDFAARGIQLVCYRSNGPSYLFRAGSGHA